jgi:K+/H+ antiporter YhaU regulatory subunit KhtT
MSINPDPQRKIQEQDDLILIGTFEGEKQFLRWGNGQTVASRQTR